jgi:ferric-dicitrate binding protein FerR (iron transport regulator)
MAVYCRPLRPSIGGGEVKVLGTSFDIKTYGKNIYTTLVTGSVLFTPPVANPIRLTPDQQTVFNCNRRRYQNKKCDCRRLDSLERR